MKQIWDFIRRKLFGWATPTKSGPSLPAPTTVGPIPPTEGGQTCTKEGGEVNISTSTSNDSSTNDKTETEIEIANNENSTSPQSTETEDKTQTAESTEPNGENSDKNPPDIGGKRGTQQDTSVTNQKPRQKFVLKPELICREVERVFEVILNVPAEYKIEGVKHSGKYHESKPNNNEYIITDFSEPITFTTADGEKDFPLFNKAKYMIFKTRKDWEGTGRYIKNLTQGFSVVITPNHWHRKSPAGVEPARCSDKKYRAHFFEIDSIDESVSFFNECKSPPIRQKMFLEGTAIQDDSAQGKLFGQKPPTLNIPSPEDVVWIRIGEEGQKKQNPWSCNFKPSEIKLEDILKDRYGHFYLRAYNKTVELIDSTEFRYYGDLSKIQIDEKSYNPKQPLPPPCDGYKVTRLEFLGVNCQPLPFTKNIEKHKEIPKQQRKARIAPSVEDDITNWILESESGKVNIAIDLPRIRWRLDSMDMGLYYDKPIRMTQHEFCDHAKSDTKLQIKLPKYIKKIEMGFNNKLDQKMSTKDIPLTSFVDYKEIESPQSNPSHLQFKWNDIIVTLIIIQSDKTTNQTKLRPIIIGNRGLSRQGKGFSKGELKRANIDITRNVSNIYYIDHKRRTVHQKNVDTLKGFTDATGR